MTSLTTFKSIEANSDSAGNSPTSLGEFYEYFAEL